MATHDEAVRTKDAHEMRLIAHPNVSSIAVIDAKSGDSTIEIGLVEDEATFLARSPDTPAVPDALDIPDATGRLPVDGPTIPVVKKIVGRITTMSFTGRSRPAHGGDSCGPAAALWFGTLGARVDMGGTPCILSNWHVLYGGTAQNDYPIVQPARPDGGFDPDDTIAHNLVGVLNDHLDAALASIDKPGDDAVGTGTRCYGPIAGIAVAAANMAVKKCGRTSESTTGTVRSTEVTIKVDGYPGGPRVFQDQIEMTPMVQSGDSGSILLNDKDEAVGLVFAGGAMSSYANKIQRVVETLGISFS
jgi:hypothetical protein